MEKTKMECPKCNEIALEDENPSYEHWRFYCKKCNHHFGKFIEIE